MKISWKIFIISYCLMVLALGFSNFYYVGSNYINKRDSIAKQAEADNRYIYSYAVSLDKLSTNEDIEKALQDLAESMSDNEYKSVFVGNEKDLGISGDDSILKVKDGCICREIKKIRGESFVQVVSRIEDTYIVTLYSLEEVMETRTNELTSYKRTVIISSSIMAVILFLFATYIAHPLKYVKKMAEIISTGDYSARINTDMRAMKSQEVKALGETMNQMAESTEYNIHELEQMLEKREIFMGDFTHEIKTPLTSIIGYGDLLRTYKQPEEKTREYGDYIYKEGKRLENLSQNLLQLLVMDNSKLQFKNEQTELLFKQIENSTKCLGEKYGVKVCFDIEDASLNVEYSLFITAVMNFIDNACKASGSGSCVWVSGKIVEDKYIVSVKDEGKGIPEKELEKITEPFYMVDKSRARSQGGAGLGLALCKRIAQLHGAEMNIASVLDEGTTVTMTVRREI